MPLYTALKAKLILIFTPWKRSFVLHSFLLYQGKQHFLKNMPGFHFVHVQLEPKPVNCIWLLKMRQWNSSSISATINLYWRQCIHINTCKMYYPEFKKHPGVSWLNADILLEWTCFSSHCNDPAQKELFCTRETPTHLSRYIMPQCHKLRCICRQPLQHTAVNTVTYAIYLYTFGLKNRQHLCI